MGNISEQMCGKKGLSYLQFPIIEDLLIYQVSYYWVLHYIDFSHVVKSK